MKLKKEDQLKIKEVFSMLWVEAEVTCDNKIELYIEPYKMNEINLDLISNFDELIRIASYIVNDLNTDMANKLFPYCKIICSGENITLSKFNKNITFEIKSGSSYNDIGDAILNHYSLLTNEVLLIDNGEIPEMRKASITYRNGVFKITDGDFSMYIKDSQELRRVDIIKLAQVEYKIYKKQVELRDGYYDI